MDSKENKENNLCMLCRTNIDVKLCQDCHKYICYSCIEKERSIKFVLKKHQKCIECNHLICCYKTICHKCDINSYHMITENIGIGSYESKYENFDVIIDLNYPENGVKENDIKVRKQNQKLIISIGLVNSNYNEDGCYKYLCEIIPLLYKYYINKKILFHCFSGVSRSAIFCIAYLSYSKSISIKQSYQKVKDIRKFIKPNDSFMKSLEKFSLYIKNV